MCDYSLMMLPNRLAVEGEQLVAHRFKSGSIGLVSCAGFTSWRAQRPGFWQRFKNCFLGQNEPGPVVCIPPGARLFLEDIGKNLREKYGFAPCETATFAQRSAESWQYRDLLVFPNGTEILLQLLGEGQKVSVLGLSSAEDFVPEPAESVPAGWGGESPQPCDAA
jgi:hypothetical protein